MSVIHWHDLERADARGTIFRLAVGGALVLGLHAAAIYGGLLFHKVETVPEPPPAAVMIELAPMAVAVHAQKEAPSPAQEAAAPPEPEETPEPVQKVMDEPPPPPEPVVEQVAEKMPELSPTPKPSEVALPKRQKEPPKKVEKRPPPERPKPRPEPRREVKRVEKPRPAPKRERSEVKRAEGTARTGAARTRTAAGAPNSSARQSSRTAAAQAGRAGSAATPRVNASSIYAHLSRFKRPQAASGRPAVRFSLSASGSVTSAGLVRSSGNPTLDREAVAMVRRASPFPPPGAPVAFSVTINFTH